LQTRADLARLGSGPKTGRNAEWRHAHDPGYAHHEDEDGHTHLAHRAEHAVYTETVAVVGVSVQGADPDDTTTLTETLTAPAEEREAGGRAKS
jgi:transposase